MADANMTKLAPANIYFQIKSHDYLPKSHNNYATSCYIGRHYEHGWCPEPTGLLYFTVIHQARIVLILVFQYFFPQCNCAGCSGPVLNGLPTYEKKCHSGICGYYEAHHWDSKKRRHCIFHEGFCSIDISVQTCSNSTLSKARLNSGTFIYGYCCNNRTKCNTEMIAPYKKSNCQMCLMQWVILLVLGFIFFLGALTVAIAVICTNKIKRRWRGSGISRTQSRVHPRSSSRRRRVASSGRVHPRSSSRRRRAASSPTIGRIQSAAALPTSLKCDNVDIAVAMAIVETTGYRDREIPTALVVSDSTMMSSDNPEARSDTTITFM